MDVSRLTALGATRAPAPPGAVEAAQAALGVRLPPALAALYAVTDGFLAPGGVTLHALEDLAERNATYEIREYCPGFILIGDDGGGTGFLVREGSEDGPVHSSGLGDLEVAGFRRPAGSLQEWVDGAG